MALLDTIQGRYKESEPFSINDLVSCDLSYGTLRTMLTYLVKKGDLCRYTSGIYYIPRKTTYGTISPLFESVLELKFITDKKEVYGYYSGLKLLNMIGLTTQVPNIPEIATNKISKRKTTYTVGKRKAIIRKATLGVDKTTAGYLQFFDIFRYATDEMIESNKDKIINFYLENNLIYELLLEIETIITPKVRRKFRRHFSDDDFTSIQK